MAQRLSEAFGQPVVVENEPAAAPRSVPTRSPRPRPTVTLLFTNDATFVLNPLLFPTLP
jgi:hypothetical protein